MSTDYSKMDVTVNWRSVEFKKTFSTSYEIGIGGLPTRIAVTKMPDKVDYVDGESISFAGLKVHAYYANGTDYGEIPLRDLLLNPWKADIEEVIEDQGGTYQVFTSPTLIAKHGSSYTYHDFVQCSANARIFLGKIENTSSGTNLAYGAVSKDPNSYFGIVSQFSGTTPSSISMRQLSRVTVDGVTYYMSAPNAFGFVREILVDLPTVTNYSTETIIGYTFGNNAKAPETGQPISVKWQRLDGLRLETSFLIHVTAS